MRLNFVIFLALLLFIVSTSFAQDFRLLNGMTGTWRNAPGTGMVGAVAIVKTGVRNETPATNGLSHYLEHMLFNGTRSLTQEQLYAVFDRFGIYSNAQTGKNYIAFMMVGRAADLDTIMGLLREQLFYSTLPEDKFGKEKGIVIQEMSKDELDDDYRFETLFDLWDKAETPYALPTLGSVATIESIGRPQVLDYYHTWFHPNNVRLLIAADAQYEDIEKTVRKNFESEVAGDIPKTTKWTRHFPTHDLFETTSVPVKEDYRWKASFPVAPMDSVQEQAALDIALNLFDTDKLFAGTSLSGVSLSLFRDADFCQLEMSGTYSGTISTDSLRAILTRALAQWKRDGVTATTLRRVRMQERVDEGKAGERLQYWGLFQAPKVAVADDELWNRIDETKKSLTQKEIVSLFEKTLSRPMRLFAETTPAAAKTSMTDTTRIVTKTLTNGVRIAVRQSPGSDLAGGHIVFAYRSAREPDSLHGIAEIAHSMLTNGPATMPKEQWRDTLAAIGLDLKTADNPDIPYDDYYTSPAFSFVRWDVPHENLVIAMNLIVETLRHPRIDSSSFATLKSAALARASRESGSPRSLASIELNKKLYASNPPVSPYGTPKTIAGITLKDVERFIHEYWNGNSAIVTIDGAEEPESILKTISVPLELLPSGSPIVPPDRKYQPVSGEIKVKAGKSQSVVLIASVRNNPPKELSSAAAVAMDIFSTKIQQELRETRGWAYSIGASIRTTPTAWVVSMQMGTKKSLLDSAANAMITMYRAFRTSSIDSSDLIRTKNANAGRQRMREAGRQYRAYALGMAILDGDDPNHALPGYTEIESVTLEDVKRAVSELPSECIIIKVE